MSDSESSNSSESEQEIVNTVNKGEKFYSGSNQDEKSDAPEYNEAVKSLFDDTPSAKANAKAKAKANAKAEKKSKVSQSSDDDSDDNSQKVSNSIESKGDDSDSDADKVTNNTDPVSLSEYYIIEKQKGIELFQNLILDDKKLRKKFKEYVLTKNKACDKEHLKLFKELKKLKKKGKKKVINHKLYYVNDKFKRYMGSMDISEEPRTRFQIAKYVRDYAKENELVGELITKVSEKSGKSFRTKQIAWDKNLNKLFGSLKKEDKCLETFGNSIVSSVKPYLIEAVKAEQ